MWNELYWKFSHKIVMLRWALFIRLAAWSYPNIKKPTYNHDTLPVLKVYNKIFNWIDELTYHLDDLIFVFSNIVRYYLLSLKTLTICKNCMYYVKGRCVFDRFELEGDDRYLARNAFWNCDEHHPGIAFKSPHVL